MKKHNRIPALLLAALLLVCTVIVPVQAEQAPEGVDYAGQMTLNMASETPKVHVTVKTFIDGDTTHFITDDPRFPDGVVKARYLAVNTPETTGKIEEYGKAAAAYTREKLTSAVSIILESDTAQWNLDSTGERHLVWVWYQPSADAPYRCLNVELLQMGLAIANSSANNRYGSVCMSAITQAKAQKLYVYSGKKDPDFYYGDAVELTLKELRTNLETYNGVKVAFSGVITMNSNNSVFIEAYDAETDMYYGMSVYYGYGLSGGGLDVLSVGNEARIVGTLQYYEAGGTWQVSGLTYRMMKPKDPGNIQKLSSGHSPAFVPVTANRFCEGAVVIRTEEGEQTYDFAPLAMATSVAMDDLHVTHVYTTQNEGSSSDGAMTLTCESNGYTVHVRTAVLRNADGSLVTADAFLNKTISVKGVVDFYDGMYQIKVLTLDSITITSD